MCSEPGKLGKWLSKWLVVCMCSEPGKLGKWLSKWLVSVCVQTIVDEQAAQLSDKQQKQVHLFHCFLAIIKQCFLQNCEVFENISK